MKIQYFPIIFVNENKLPHQSSLFSGSGPAESDYKLVNLFLCIPKGHSNLITTMCFQWKYEKIIQKRSHSATFLIIV